MFKRIKNLIKPQKESLFLADGSVKLTEENGDLIHAILIVFAGPGAPTIPAINLELLRCGFLITLPDLKKVLAYMAKEGLISIR